MLDVRRLRLLRELAHRGTIAAVAEALAFSPSAVSQQLTALEREAGVALLERTGRRVMLTPAAHGLVRHAEAVLAVLEQAAAELAEAKRGPAGPLRIGTFPSAARVVIPPALVLLAERWPELEPMVAEVDPAGVADLLRSGELDVALVHDYDFVPAPVEPGIASEPLFAEAMYLATAEPGPGTPGPVRRILPSAPRSAGQALAAHAGDPWILATHGTLCHAMAIRACQAAGFTPRIRHRVDDFDTVLALVAAEQGVALVPELGLLAPPAAVHLHRLPMSRRTTVAFRHGAGGHPAVAAFGAAVRATLPVILRNS
ncbi:LysR family transcriptional regulator [Kitasatospora kifunensis]|uniref:DNA-binding transcriptional LysR family regulator n=1 Tax=Kitasatospora kifunensis TaxID=58351 RepID=A0A7W7QZR0_KITKI|nr:LysR family transcriptional regulator [Kitasatospora kifunensis]MBB4922821.1 DNA-binding transcriptional LysR family regulator [Kitasatospora kifunensis]